MTKDALFTSSHEAMQKARSALLLSHPFFGSLALKLTLKADVHSPDLWTDGKTLGYNPHFIAVLSHEQIMGVQAHEILHLACGHHVRRKGRDPKLWNKACDLAINGMLVDAGFTLPSSYNQDTQYSTLSVDAIYMELQRLLDEESRGGAKEAKVQEHSEEEGQSTLSSSEGEEGEEQGDDQKNSGGGEQADGMSTQQEESEQSGNTDANTQGDTSKESKTEFSGEVLDHPLLDAQSGPEAEQAEREAMVNLSQALQSAKHFGDIPLSLWRVVQETLQPTLDWRILLQRFLESCNTGDYTWSVPNRRYISQNIYLPSRNEQRMQTVALAVDCSGSIDKPLLSLFCAELESILEAYECDLYIFYHDTLVKKCEVYGRQDRPLRLMPEGGGGTDYRHIPAAVEQECHPICLLWFTDLECASYPEEPFYPVLWVSSKMQKNPPPFGEVVYLLET